MLFLSWPSNSGSTLYFCKSNRWGMTVCPTSPNVFSGSGESLEYVPQGVMWGVLWEYEVDGLYYRQFDVCTVGVRAWFALWSVSKHLSQSGLVPNKADLLLPALFIILMDIISRRSQTAVGVKFGGLWIPPLLFADDVVLLVWYWC